MSSAVAAVSLYFKKYFNVAMAISNSGAGVGIMLMGTVLELTVVSYGWKGAMLIQAGIMMQVVVCGSLIFKRKANELPSGGAKCDNKPSMYEQHSEDGPTQGDRSRLPLYRFILKMCNNKQFVLLMVVFFLYFFYFNIYLLIQKDLFLNKHFDYTFEVIILCFGVSNIVGRVLSGFISEYVLVPTLQFVVSTTLASVAVIGLAYIQQAWMYFLLTVIFGFCVGQQASLFNLIIAHLFNRQLTPIFFSFGLVMGANGYIGGAPVAGMGPITRFSSSCCYSLYKSVFLILRLHDRCHRIVHWNNVVDHYRMLRFGFSHISVSFLGQEARIDI